MTTHHLEGMFHPTSVAVIGASQEPGSVGAIVVRNLFGAGFDGEIFPVTPHYATIEGARTFPDIARLPTIPDLAIIATPLETVPGVIAALGQRGTNAAVVLTGGSGEAGNERRHTLQTAMLEAARPHLLRILGPHCLGIMVPGGKLNASVGHIHPLPGTLALVVQSDAVLTSVLDWATAHHIGFSHLVSLGDMADVDVGDMLDYLATEPQTRAILLYIETITQARKFLSAARAAARIKPVIAVKASCYAADVPAAMSHLGALIGTDAIYDMAFRRAGVLRVNNVQALFDVVETLAMIRPFPGDRLAIVTNSRSIGKLAIDALSEQGGRLARLSPETLQRLPPLPGTEFPENPVDIGDAAPARRYAEVFEALCTDQDVDAMLILNCPTALACRTAAAQAVITAVEQQRTRGWRRGLFTCWLGEHTAGAARQALTEKGIPTYPTPEEAVRAFTQMVRYRHSQELLMQTPPTVPDTFTPETAQALHVVETALAAERSWLATHETRAVLAAYGIPIVTTRVAQTPEEAAQLAAEVQGAIALTLLSLDIADKAEVGGVALHLETPAAVREAAMAMLALVRRVRPEARIEGWTVQPMFPWPHAQVLRIGMFDDALFGPVLVFGHDGTALPVSQERALALPPLNMHLARDMMAHTNISQLLGGYGGPSAAALETLALTLVKVSQLICDRPEIAALDMHPLLASPQGIIALDARIHVVRATRPGAARLAICPYPKELEETLHLPDGTTLLLRPIRPEDEPAWQVLFQQLSMDEIRLRFFRPMKRLSHELAACLTQLNYDREMALVLAGTAASGTAELYGEVRVMAEPNNEQAEFAMLIRRDMTGKGLGPLLLRRIIDYAKQRGIRQMYGEVLSENRAMLRLCQAFGFILKAVPNDPGVIRATLSL
jgi:acetyltransferase